MLRGINVLTGHYNSENLFGIQVRIKVVDFSPPENADVSTLLILLKSFNFAQDKFWVYRNLKLFF